MTILDDNLKRDMKLLLILDLTNNFSSKVLLQNDENSFVGEKTSFIFLLFSFLTLWHYFPLRCKGLP